MIAIPVHRTLHPLGSLSRLRADRLRFYREMRGRYGDFVRFRLGPHSITLVSDPEAAHEILEGDGPRFRKGLGNDTLAPILEHAMFLAEGEAWACARRTLKPHYGPDKIPGYARATWDEGAALARRLIAEGGAPLYPAVRDAVVTLSGRLLVGDPALCADASLRADLNQVWLDLAWRQDALRRFLGRGRHREYQRRLARIRAALASAVELTRGRAQPQSLLGWIVRATDPKGAGMLPAAAVLDEAATLVFSAQECLAIAAAWTLHQLATVADVQEALVEETGRDPPASTKDVLGQELLRSVLYETLRLYPPAWLLSRAAIGDQEVGGRQLADGRTVFISPYVIGRHPDHWTDADAFDPRRFLGRVQRRAFLPFGAGPRTCLGMRLALGMVATLVRAVLVHARLAPGEGPSAPVPGLTLRPDDALCIRAKPR